MTIREFQETIEFNIEHNLKHSILGLGAPGVGKSQIIRRIGKKYGFKVIDIRLAQMSEVEIGGLIYPNESRTKTVWLAPDILPNEERDGKNTILLLDEITSCTKRVQVAAYQLILDRRIGQYTLPEGTFVVALGNREDDDGVYIHLAGPLADRFEIHYIESDFESWKYDFALKNGIHPFVIDFLTFKPAALHTQDPDSGEMVFATPRSWERVSDILNIDDDIHKEVIKNKIIGNVGTVEGTQFVEYCKQHHQTVPVQKLLDGSVKMPDSPEELALLADRLTNHVSFLAKNDTTSLPQEQEKQVEDVILALIRLPQAEYALMGLKKLMEMNREAVKKVFSGMDQPEVIRFVERHKFAMGLTAGGLSGDARKNWMALWK